MLRDAALALGIILFLAFVVCVLRGQFLFSEMVERLNERLPAENEYNGVIGFWTPMKRQRFWTEWRRNFPEDSLTRSYRITQILAFVLWAAIAVLVFSLSKL